MKKFIFMVFLSLSFVLNAKIITKKVTYSSDGQEFEGFLAYDSKIKSKVPGALVIHNWMGVTGETESKAIEFAKLGVVAFAVDVYGKGIRPTDTKQAGELATKYKSERNLFRERLNLGLEELKKNKNVDANKLVALGYCFGGTGAIELARSGVDLKGFVSFHGGLNALKSLEAKQVKGKIIAFHGVNDPYVPREEVLGFLSEMSNVKADYEFVMYANAVHSFTEKAAGNDPSKGAAYNEIADRASFERTKDFLKSL